MEKTPKEKDRNDTLEKILVWTLETSKEHGLNVVDILVSFMNNRMLQEERDDIIDLLKKEDQIMSSEYKLVIYYDGGYENIYGIFPSEVARFLRKSDDVLENGFESRFIDFPHEHGYVEIDDEENIRILDKMPEEEGYSELILLNGDYLYGQGKGRVIEVARDKIFSFDAYEDTEEYTLDRFIERVNNF